MAKWKEPIRATDYNARAEAAEAEVARLREALQLYAGGDFTGQGIAWEPIDDKGAVARAALNPKTDT